MVKTRMVCPRCADTLSMSLDNDLGCFTCGYQDPKLPDSTDYNRLIAPWIAEMEEARNHADACTYEGCTKILTHRNGTGFCNMHWPRGAKRMKFKCIECGQDYETKASAYWVRFNKLRDAPGLACSQRCSAIWNRKHGKRRNYNG